MIQRSRLYHTHIQFLNLFSCPRGFSKKLETGLYTWIAVKTIDPDMLPEIFPPEMCYQCCDDNLKRFTM